MLGKKGMIRIVRGSDGTISVDETGKKAGRGAYLCRDAECLSKARKKRGLERSLKCAVPAEVYEQLEREMNEA